MPLASRFLFPGGAFLAFLLVLFLGLLGTLIWESGARRRVRDAVVASR